MAHSRPIPTNPGCVGKLTMSLTPSAHQMVSVTPSCASRRTALQAEGCIFGDVKRHCVGSNHSGCCIGSYASLCTWERRGMKRPCRPGRAGPHRLIWAAAAWPRNLLLRREQTTSGPVAFLVAAGGCGDKDKANGTGSSAALRFALCGDRKVVVAATSSCGGSKRRQGR